MPQVIFIIKFTYNVGSDWLEKNALSENREQVNDFQLALKFSFVKLTNWTQIKDPLKIRQTQRIITSYLPAGNMVQADHC